MGIAYLKSGKLISGLMNRKIRMENKKIKLEF